MALDESPDGSPTEPDPGTADLYELDAVDESPPIDATSPGAAAAPLAPRADQALTGDDDQHKHATDPPAPRRVGATTIEQALLDREFDTKPDLLRERYVPWSLLAVGLILQIVLTLAWLDDSKVAAITVIASLAAQAIIAAPLLIASIVVSSRWFGMELGALRRATFFVAALAFGPAAVADVLVTTALVEGDVTISYFVAGFAVFINFVLWPLAYLFQMEVRDAAAIVTANFFVHVCGCALAATWLA